MASSGFNFDGGFHQSESSFSADLLVAPRTGGGAVGKLEENEFPHVEYVESMEIGELYEMMDVVSSISKGEDDDYSEVLETAKRTFRTHLKGKVISGWKNLVDDQKKKKIVTWSKGLNSEDCERRRIIAKSLASVHALEIEKLYFSKDCEYRDVSYILSGYCTDLKRIKEHEKVYVSQKKTVEKDVLQNDDLELKYYALQGYHVIVFLLSKTLNKTDCFKFITESIKISPTMDKKTKKCLYDVYFLLVQDLLIHGQLKSEQQSKIVDIGIVDYGKLGKRTVRSSLGLLSVIVEFVSKPILAKRLEKIFSKIGEYVVKDDKDLTKIKKSVSNAALLVFKSMRSQYGKELLVSFKVKIINFLASEKWFDNEAGIRLVAALCCAKGIVGDSKMRKFIKKMIVPFSEILEKNSEKGETDFICLDAILECFSNLAKYDNKFVFEKFLDKYMSAILNFVKNEKEVGFLKCVIHSLEAVMKFVERSNFPKFGEIISKFHDLLSPKLIGLLDKFPNADFEENIISVLETCTTVSPDNGNPVKLMDLLWTKFSKNLKKKKMTFFKLMGLCFKKRDGIKEKMFLKCYKTIVPEMMKNNSKTQCSDLLRILSRMSRSSTKDFPKNDADMVKIIMKFVKTYKGQEDFKNIADIIVNLQIKDTMIQTEVKKIKPNELTKGLQNDYYRIIQSFKRELRTGGVNLPAQQNWGGGGFGFGGGFGGGGGWNWGGGANSTAATGYDFGGMDNWG